jgi:serine/threonine-protein phosphatase 2A regulatory subunit A
LSSLCVGWLGDDIASIRAAAASNLKELAALFGTDWTIDFLIPAIIDIRQHKSYLRRLTALQACAMMAIVVDADAARDEMLPLVLEMSTDAVSCVL